VRPTAFRGPPPKACSPRGATRASDEKRHVQDPVLFGEFAETISDQGFEISRSEELTICKRKPCRQAADQPAPSTVSCKRPRSGFCLFHLSSGLKPFGSRGGSSTGACVRACSIETRVGWHRQAATDCGLAATRLQCMSNRADGLSLDLYPASDRAKKSSCFHGVVGIARCSRRPPAFSLHAPPRRAGRNTKDEGGLLVVSR
jgi:hypothetical protein